MAQICLIEVVDTDGKQKNLREESVNLETDEWLMFRKQWEGEQ